MPKKDYDDRPRLLLLLIFVLVFGLLLYNAVRLWPGSDASEKWARAAELPLIALGAWVVVWPESLPPWRSSKRATAPKSEAKLQG
jgi:hypothetical protein